MHVLAERTASCEALIKSSYASNLEGKLPCAVLAVGGFGRAELFPHSDVDILLLVESADAAQAAKADLSTFLRNLWDSGMRLSHSVHTVDECCQVHDGNTELSISLLDQRMLTGLPGLYDRLEKKLPEFLRGKSAVLTRRLAELARSRHSKYHATIYHLEPDIKETCGGLRDLHLVQWFGKLGGKSFPPELKASRDFLFWLRFGLHQRSGRDKNILDFESQDALSSQPEDLMRDYYRHARAVHRCALWMIDAAETTRDKSLLEQFRSWRGRLSNSDFTVSRDQVLARSPQQLRHDLALVLRLFAFTSRHQLMLAADTEARLLEFHAQPEDLKWPAVTTLLRMQRAAWALRQMNATGVLNKVLPEWKDIECLVVRDFYHRYTVDEHTIVALESIEPPHDARLATLLEETGRIELLRLALVFHDIGKGDGDHVRESAEIVRRVMTRWEAPAEDIDTVEFLVLHHITLSNVMSKRDLADPATARDLAEQVGTIENLKLLTLLTYADISAVYPGAMTPWRLEQLCRVYLATHEELTRELETDRIPAALEGATPEESALLEGLPARFLRTHSKPEISRIMKLAREQKEEQAAVEIDRHHGAWRATILAADRPALFASLAGALAGFGFNILKAEAFANARSVVLDTFAFEDPHRNLEQNPEEVDRLQRVLVRTALGKHNVSQVLEGRKRAHKQKRTLQPKVGVSNLAVDNATLVEVLAEDRPGLLHDLASIISTAGYDIDVVLIDTEAHKALDVFYLKRPGGGQVPEEAHAPLRQQLLEVCVS
jgi:[protein-PII] uridylyltransferase